jgi:hypothetical protein
MISVDMDSVVGHCEHDIEPSDSVKDEDIPGQLNACLASLSLCSMEFASYLFNVRWK